MEINNHYINAVNEHKIWQQLNEREMNALAKVCISDQMHLHIADNTKQLAQIMSLTTSFMSVCSENY